MATVLLMVVAGIVVAPVAAHEAVEHEEPELLNHWRTQVHLLFQWAHWPNLMFFDNHGQRRAVLDIGLGGWPVFALADDRGDDRAVLQVAPDGTPVLVLFDRMGRVVWKTP